MTVGSQVKSCYASIKSIESALESLHETTRNNELQTAIEQANILLYEVKNDMNNQVIKLTKEEPQYKS
ncbi:MULTISPECIES: DUF1657 domain-containing protein [Oceanobacillus]|uniref:DUF1657 domain-containing protein n=1 Tax=Oceanobacillus kimchii TaxID=746691 RepID=A0ABQ5TIH3_9BACI|nr:MULTISPECIES: DUF1657 domain-containing protein [Oceanobacillus]MBT2598885.1 DUF1657 domain-containing protein [Oceanobacillus sp. ISL-74]MBT2651804.1 DUF1657 domain-containing protein [Oceanobacillus sp. ISL-73]MCT1576453.1 DUF1657 domain-containing protein [Oceanobacillus kimchii]MCT2136089.1 DUF1657 domain-containing protein [Oceanobacillus kimchii]OEH54493.1 hypothetical protein AQ616_12100 [Oceanobacillus sp. E9]